MVAALLLIGPLVATAILDQGGSPRLNVSTIGFGTGGSECELTDVASSFRRGVPIRNVITFSPTLPRGTTVTVRMERDGRELADQRETIILEEPTDCLFGTITPSEPGHYRVEVRVDPSTMPPIIGEFELTI